MITPPEEYTRTLTTRAKLADGTIREYKYQYPSKTGRTFKSLIPEERKIDIAAHAERYGIEKAAKKFGVCKKTARKYLAVYYGQ